MKALSIHPYYAQAIVSGQKSIECRTWSTEYRGDILICSTAKKFKGTIPAHALGIVTLEDIRPFKKSDLKAALMDSREFSDGTFAWILTYNRLIEPIPIKGKLSLWDFEEEEKIKLIPEEEWLTDDPLKAGRWLEKYWRPLMV